MRQGSRLRMAVLLVATGCLVAGSAGRSEEMAGPRPAAARAALSVGGLVGTWTLASVEERRPDGEIIHWMGRTPRGLLVYDRTGHVSVQIMRDPIPALTDDARASLEELRGAFDGYYAYFGTYDVDAGAATVIHHVKGSMRPFEIGRDYRRRVRLVDDRLVLSLSATRSLTWRRLR